MKRKDFSNLQFLKDSLQRILPNSQAVALAIILIVGFLLITSLADVLMPVFIAIVLAYLLEGMVKKLEHKLRRLPAVFIVFSGFMGGFSYLLFGLMPMLYKQLKQLLQHTPDIIKSSQAEILKLPEAYPQFISADKLRDFMFAIQQEALNYGQDLLSFSASSVVGIMSALVYLILVPVLIFFCLKDKAVLLNWFAKFLPRDRLLSINVWAEVDMQLGNYIRGKFVEVVILGLASYMTFSALGLNYAVLLSVFMGLQVIIPYVGATLVTFPVLGVAFFQWGFSGDEFMYIVIAYSIIQAIDGVVLVPLLFSEAVNLHPVAIIVAILFFGGLWGFWGVFFAIPLATLVKAVVSAWPRLDDKMHTFDM
ncbi:MAG: AI-2E family transporter [Gammaproteobacteria bacterium]|nr:AI-2E family transporter [Gammaproteobacteria bacterium]MBT5966965.1 AI-2E family transporter [Gammaproteobacteria bacterium]MBT7434593.1 AI-2E family transporter [Gammaproteobacteria bacterium]